MSEIIFLSIIGLGITLCLLRMLKGPTASDRAVAVDTIATITTALLVLLGFIFERYVHRWRWDNAAGLVAKDIGYCLVYPYHQSYL